MVESIYNNNKEVQGKDLRYRDKDWLYDQYITQKQDSVQIGRKCNVSNVTIGNWLRKFNIPIRTKKEEIIGKNNPFYGKHHTEATKKKMSEVKKGEKSVWFGKHHTEATKKKMSEARKGHIVSNETKQKLSEFHKGIILSDETKQRIKESNTGKTRTEAQKQKYSESKKGEKNPFYGKHHSVETRKKISEKMSVLKKGSNNSRWNPNRAEVYAPYGVNFYDDVIREEKWKLQNGRDLLNGSKLERGTKSHFHHIDYDKSNDSSDNFCWLYINSHNKISNFQVYSPIKAEHYKKLLQNNLQLLKEGKIPKNWNLKNQELFKQEKMVQLKIIEIKVK